MQYNMDLELYKICVDQAEKISERRMKCNGFFITLHSAIFSFLSISYKITDNQSQAILLSFSIFCIILCYIWDETLQSYKQLNEAKYKVILEIENNLKHKCFSKEWEILSAMDGYKPISIQEQKIPTIFFILYLIIATLLFIKIC